MIDYWQKLLVLSVLYIKQTIKKISVENKDNIRNKKKNKQLDRTTVYKTLLKLETMTKQQELYLKTNGTYHVAQTVFF